MCSIAGIYGKNSKQIKEINSLLNHRGPDRSKIVDFYGLKLAHNLLSIVGYMPQPLKTEKEILIANCEIYNWKELSKKEKILAKSDSELLFKLLIKNKKDIKKTINKLNGDFSFAFFYKTKNKIFGHIARDIFGIKPLWYYLDKNNFYFASERKSLPLDIRDKSIDLNPRILLNIEIDLIKNKVKLSENYLGFLEQKTKNINYEKAKKETEILIRESIKNRVESDKPLGVLVSGGVDSCLIAKLSEEYNAKVKFYNISIENKGQDKEYAKLMQKELKNKIKFITVKEESAIKKIPEVVKIIETADPVKVSIALPFYFLAKEMQKDKVKVVLIGNGADSLFCGFSRFLENYSPTKDTISRLRKLYDTDCYRDDTIFMNFNIEARFPYLDKALVKYVINLEDKYKIENEIKKKILRDISSKYLPKEIAYRKKKAIQYGSGFDKIITKAQKLNKGLTRGQFLRKTINENEKLACLFSGGKDSVLALHIMKNMNYKISCLITINSKNKYSYMYHTPTIELVKQQALSLDIPLIEINTLGEKEKELEALKKGLKLAKEKYNINGVITGAIFSTYQRDRVENISDKLGLKVFSPLWHKEQKEEVNELISLDIKAIITKIAGYGLNAKYLGKIIDKNMLLELEKLNNKFGFNIAGEGGEYETFVIDSPLFNKKIIIEKSKIKEENEYSAELIIDKIKLEEK